MPPDRVGLCHVIGFVKNPFEATVAHVDPLFEMVAMRVPLYDRYTVPFAIVSR